MLSFELAARADGYSNIIGIDEVGRGPLAGPVVVAGVILPLDFNSEVITDSKQLSAKKREAIAHDLLNDSTVLRAIVEVDVEIVDQINILQATWYGMRQVATELQALGGDFILVDGNPVPGLPLPSKNIIKGDSKSLSIAAASIIAKVHRDNIMTLAHETYPNYGFDHNSGYGTAQHLAALKEFGVTPIHRRTFKPVRDIITPPPTQTTFDF